MQSRIAAWFVAFCRLIEARPVLCRALRSRHADSLIFPSFKIRRENTTTSRIEHPSGFASDIQSDVGAFVTAREVRSLSALSRARARKGRKARGGCQKGQNEVSQNFLGCHKRTGVATRKLSVRLLFKEIP